MAKGKIVAEPKHKPFSAVVVAKYGDGYAASTRPIDKRRYVGEIGFPGGKLDPGETPRQAAIREAGEEGWDVKNVTDEPIHYTNFGDKTVAVFAAESASKKKKYKEIGREIYPVTASKHELSESHECNSFAKYIDDNNHMSVIKTASLLGLLEKMAGNMISKIPAQPLPIAPSREQMMAEAAQGNVDATAERNISGGGAQLQRSPK